MNEKVPKEELLLKMLNMTTSDNEGVTLVAIRKANELLTSAGWSWEKLLAAKITVVADPFASLATPKRGENQPSFAPPPPKPKPQNQFSWQHAPTTPPPPPPPPKPKPSIPYSDKPNRYGNHCYCCGSFVDSMKGWIMNPQQEAKRGPDRWVVICDRDNRNKPPITKSPAKRDNSTKMQSVGIDPSLGDL